MNEHDARVVLTGAGRERAIIDPIVEGCNSPNVVIKHYSPWVLERQKVLEKKVRASWATEGAA